MKVEIIRRGGHPVQNSQPQQPMQPENNEPANFLTRGAYALGRGAESGGDLFNALMGLIGEPQTFKSNVEQLREKAGYTPQQVAPQSPLEEILHGGISKLPASFALGGGIPQAALGFLGSGARKGAEELGLGPIGQTVAELGTEIGGSAAYRGLGPSSIRKKLRPEMKKLYQIAEHEVTKVPKQDATKVTDFLNKTIEELPTSGLDSPTRKVLKTELDNIGKNIAKNEIDPAIVWKSKKHIGNLLKTELAKTDSNMPLVNLYKRTIGNLNENLSEVASKFPKFGESFNKAEDIFKGLDAPAQVRKFFEEHTTLNSILKKDPFTKAVMLIGSGSIGGLPLAATVAAAPFVGRYATRAYDVFTKSKTAQTLVYKILEDIKHDSVRSAANSLIKLKKEIAKEEESSPEPMKKSGIKIIRRGQAA